MAVQHTDSGYRREATLALPSTALASVIFCRLIRALGPVTTTSNACLRALMSVAFGVVLVARPGRELRRAG